MKNLQMSLRTKWFEMTKAGIKTEDYREITPYWLKRLTQHEGVVADECERLLKGEYADENFKYGIESKVRKAYCFPKKFTTNIMTLGYPKSGDTERIIKLEHKGIEIRTGNSEWGAEEGKLYFVIKHGKIL
jgi:hypothetical protein